MRLKAGRDEPNCTVVLVLVGSSCKNETSSYNLCHCSHTWGLAYILQYFLNKRSVPPPPPFQFGISETS